MVLRQSDTDITVLHLWLATGRSTQPEEFHDAAECLIAAEQEEAQQPQAWCCRSLDLIFINLEDGCSGLFWKSILISEGLK